MVKIIDVSMMISSDATVHTCEGLRVDRDSFRYLRGTGLISIVAHF